MQDATDQGRRKWVSYEELDAIQCVCNVMADDAKLKDSARASVHSDMYARVNVRDFFSNVVFETVISEGTRHTLSNTCANDSAVHEFIQSVFNIDGVFE